MYNIVALTFAIALAMFTAYTQLLPLVQHFAELTARMPH